MQSHYINQQQQINNEQNFDDSDENLEKCFNCQSLPDDILMLACEHDLCLNCAAFNYQAQKLQDKFGANDYSSKSLMVNNIQQFCKQHPEEEVMYFCFTCETSCLCAECVINGTHKDHEVKTIKKAYPQIKQIMAQCFTGINQQTQKLNQKKVRMIQIYLIYKKVSHLTNIFIKGRFI
ncbi:hypothetical protein PPERSA_00989 [Pseudocohnilembus persalinus]|uniref:B box-type domain-containing protein n=1 Tax=Pseudocohnilembus persalinus TaxID=266149 RepID=A0A0V0R8L7_PSEPJ|nr:hypothetical protein PPERSA_00989 [Pseudocohnilembus persalinus]|eukprot:KRX10819.1 hypothetical protein PPERSA_00989 [Pseudocohnilembus persalinus]